MENKISDDNLKKGKISFEDELARNFDDVLEKNETIVKGYKPNKTKMFFSSIFAVGILFLMFLILGILTLCFPDEAGNEIIPIVILCSIIGFFVLVLIFDVIFVSILYKNTYYVYTNKRIIVRTGVFGVDFHSLDLKNIGASDVYVSLIDKMLRKNTGSIKFGSNSSPIGGQNSYNYGFLHIQDPYKEYKEIKEYIASVQEK